MNKIKINDTEINYYKLLHVNETCTLEDLKKKYKKLALKYHPDKNINDNNTTALQQFINVKNAFDILSNPSSRKLYDMHLLREKALKHKEMMICQEINVHELSQEIDENDEDIFIYPCRCGEYYMVSKAELNSRINVTGCWGCSLYIKILYPNTG